MYQLFSLETLASEFPIINTDCQAIVNFVNCDGTMSYKLGARLKGIHPEMYESYKKACIINKNFSKGNVLIWKKTNPWIIHIPVRNSWKDDFKQDFIEEGIKKLFEVALKFKLNSLAIQENHINDDLLKKLINENNITDMTIKYYPENSI